MLRRIASSPDLGRVVRESMLHEEASIAALLGGPCTWLLVEYSGIVPEKTST